MFICARTANLNDNYLLSVFTIINRILAMISYDVPTLPSDFVSSRTKRLRMITRIKLTVYFQNTFENHLYSGHYRQSVKLMLEVKSTYTQRKRWNTIVFGSFVCVVLNVSILTVRWDRVGT